MTTPLRTALFVSAGLGSLLGLTVLGASRGTVAAGAAAEADWSSMRHEVFVFDETNLGAGQRLAVDFVEHTGVAHPATHFSTYQVWYGDRPEVHLLEETVNTTAFFLAEEELEGCETCGPLLSTMATDFTRKHRSLSRLIESDPEKERSLGPQSALIVRSLRASYPRTGEAVDAARELVQHMNATYPEIYVRAYDEWHPRSGRIHFHIHLSWVPTWESIEARMRADPEVRRILGGAAAAFVEDSFEDVWLITLGR